MEAKREREREVYIHIYIYIYRERERDRETEGDRAVKHDAAEQLPISPDRASVAYSEGTAPAIFQARRISKARRSTTQATLRSRNGTTIAVLLL